LAGPTADLDLGRAGLPVPGSVTTFGRLWISRQAHRTVGRIAPNSTRLLYERWNADPRSLSLVIPAYNEEDRITKALNAYLPVLERLRVPHEVIVICDGQDGTPAVVRSYGDRGVVCYEYSTKMGRGGAILEGFRKSTGDLVAFADADGSVPAADFEHLVQLAFQGAPAVIASRRLMPDLVPVPEPAFRRSIGFAWHLLVKMLLGLRLEDAQCGLKIFSKRVVHEVILKQLTVTNRTFEVGMLFHVAKSGIPILEVPVRYVHDFDTRMPIRGAVPIMFLTLVGILLSNRWVSKDGQPPAFAMDLKRRFATV